MSQLQPSQTDQGPGAAPVSVGTLFYLWGDRLVEAAGTLGGTTLPSGAKVSAKQLAPLLFAASFARLQGDGALQLEVVTKKSLGFKKQHVQVTPAANPGMRGGYEEAIVQQVTAGATTAWDVVHRWFGRDVTHPEGRVFGLAQQEMVVQGLAQVEENVRSGVKGMLLGKDKVEPLLDRVNGTHAQFAQFKAWWESYQRHDPALAEALLDTCRKAIRSRQESD